MNESDGKEFEDNIEELARHLNAFVKKHFRRIERIALGHNVPQFDVEEPVNNALTKLWKHLSDPSAEPIDNWLAWIRVVLYRECMDYFRRTTQEQKRRRLLEMELAHLAIAVDMPADSESEESKAMLATATMEAMKLLPPIKQTILFMKYIEERPYSEIADLLGDTIDAVKSKCRRARLEVPKLVEELNWPAAVTVDQS